MNDEVMVKVEGVSKKFCRTLKRSLWYGLKDIGTELVGKSKHSDELRKDEFWAVKDVSFELRRGECLGLIGHNGAGKSTLLKMLNGLIKPDQGSITMKGRIGALIELGAGFNPILTGRENVYVNGQIIGFTKKEIDAKLNQIVEFAEIGEFIDTPVQNYSSGMKVRLGFAVAAQMEPDVLLVDEVLAVGDIGFRSKCINRITELLENTVVIFVSHGMPNVARLCTAVCLLNKGKSIYFSEDISTGIEKYYDLFSLSTGGRVVGDGIGKIKVCVYSNSNEVKKDNLVVYGEDMFIEIMFVPTKQFDNVNIGIPIFDKELKNIASTGVSGIKPLKDVENTVKVKISKNQFNSGKYSINLHFTTTNNNDKPIVLAKAQQIQEYSVIGSVSGNHAPFQLKNEVELL